MSGSRRLRPMALLLAGLLVVLLMAGCAKTSAVQDMPDSSAGVVESENEVVTDEDSSTPSLPVIDPADTVDPNKKVIYTVTMSVEVENTADAIADITAAAAQAGGYISSSEYYEDGSTMASYIVVRIPPDRLSDFAGQVAKMGDVQHQTMSSQDVTDQYTDLSAQLKNAQAQETQLLAIMERAVTIEDTLLVREQLSQVQQEIEQLKGQIQLMDNQVGYSTVTINLTEPEPPAVTEDDGGSQVQFWGFKAIWQRITRGFSNSFNWTLNALGVLLMGLSYVLLPLAIIAAGVLGLIYLIRWLVRRPHKNRAKK